jgi:magnesium transporter
MDRSTGAGVNPSTTHTRAYRKGVLEAEDFPLAEVSDHLADTETVVWVDLCNTSEAQLQELADELAVHELAVEDALEPHQRPKLDQYSSHLFLSCHAVALDKDRAQLEVTEIDAFIGRKWLVTVRDADHFDITQVLHRWDRSPDLAQFGIGFLLYGLLDVVVDDYRRVVEGLDEFYDEVSGILFTEHPLDPSQQRSWFEMRRALVKFHQLISPMREVLSSLMRPDHHLVNNELQPYYEDVYDHTLLANESTDALRDLVSTIVETNLSLRDYRENQIVKKVSSWAAIIAVPAFLTGYFGMNVPYPGSGEEWGVLLASVIIVVASGGLYVVFKRVGWL